MPKYSMIKNKPRERKSWAKLQVKLIFADDFMTGKKFNCTRVVYSGFLVPTLQKLIIGLRRSLCDRES